MGQNWLKNYKFSIFLQWFLLLVLLCILVYSVWEVTYELASLGHEGVHASHRGPLFFVHPNPSAQLSASDIQGWMTFRYVNFVFHLAPDYLQGQLKITDTKYPNISVDSLAKEQKITSAQELAALQLAIKNYSVLEPASSANTPSLTP